jgi:two-component system response regulator DevR
MNPETHEERLTIGQTRVLLLLLEDRSNRAIAEALRISESTVKNHVSGIYRRTGVHGRIQLVGWCLARTRSGRENVQTTTN